MFQLANGLIGQHLEVSAHTADEEEPSGTCAANRRPTTYASVVGVPTTTGNVTSQLFEFLLPMTRIADEVVGLVH